MSYVFLDMAVSYVFFRYGGGQTTNPLSSVDPSAEKSAAVQRVAGTQRAVIYAYVRNAHYNSVTQLAGVISVYIVGYTYRSACSGYLDVFYKRTQVLSCLRFYGVISICN